MRVIPAKGAACGSFPAMILGIKLKLGEATRGNAPMVFVCVDLANPQLIRPQRRPKSTRVLSDDRHRDELPRTRTSLH